MCANWCFFSHQLLKTKIHCRNMRVRFTATSTLTRHRAKTQNASPRCRIDRNMSEILDRFEKEKNNNIICLLDRSEAGQVVCSQYHMTQVLREEMIVAGVSLGKRMTKLEPSSSLRVRLSARWQRATKLCHSLLSSFRTTEAQFSSH